jgi:Bifunctional DNA primase/polymerase, N-terminal
MTGFMDDPHTLLMDLAWQYAGMGLPVLPLRPGRKEPASLHGKDDATTDQDQVVEWWNRNTRYNIGVRSPVGYVVLDVDPRNGGTDSLQEILKGHSLPKTWMARTGSGGWHIWFKAHGPFRGQLCRGVDIKSNTGYVVMPPSVHPNGQRYRIVQDEPPAPAPAWLLREMRPKRVEKFTPTPGSSNSTSGLVRAVAEAPRHDQLRGANNTLYWAARRAVEEGTYDEIRNELIEAAQGDDRSDGWLRAIERTLKSAEKWRTA